MGSGSQTQSTKLPQWVTQAGQDNIARARDVEQIGYTPYYGPDVAAFTPMQQAAFQNTGQAANAFGMAGGGLLGMEGVPQAQEFAGGQMGYSSAPMFEEAMQQFAQNRPGQYQAINDMFINPMTGQMQGGQQGYSGASGGSGMANLLRGSGGSDRDYSRPYSGGGGGFQGPNLNGDVGYGAGGYSSFSDMFDGGGAGRSGDTFQGGGALSTAANVVASPRERSASSGMGGGK